MFTIQGNHDIIRNPNKYLLQDFTSVGLFTVYFIILQKYLYNKYSLLIYIYIYVYIQNCDNVTMYYYMHFSTLLHVMYYVFSMYVFLYVWPNVTDVWLLRLAQSVLTYIGQPLTVGKRESHEHVAWDHVTLVSPMLWRYTELNYTVYYTCSVYGLLYSIMTVWLNHAIIYAMALR